MRLKTPIMLSMYLLLVFSILPTFKTASANQTAIIVDPQNSYGAVGKTLSININVTNVSNLTCWQFTLYFLNSKLNCTDVIEGPFLKSVGGTYFGKQINNNFNSTHGRILAYSTLLGQKSVSGSGIIAIVKFKALNVGDSPLHLSDTMLGDEKIPPKPIPHITIDGTAHIQNFILTIITVGSGSVNVNATPPYYYGEVVLLTAIPAQGWYFHHWSGNLTGSMNPATLTIIANMSVTATFIQEAYTLTINIVGNGNVILNNTGPYNYGDVVLLIAVPASNWAFQCWSGDLSGSTNPAILMMTANYSVTATFLQKPKLQISPAGKTCRIYGEHFTLTLNISNAYDVKRVSFEIRYNTTMLDYVSVTWIAWGSGTVNVDEANGIIKGSTGGTPKSGAYKLFTIKFKSSLYHIWKSAPSWQNNLTDNIFLQWANVSYPSGPDLHYEKGDQTQINVGPDFTYAFSPIQGDVNNNGIVDVYDLRPIGAYYNVKQGDQNWNEALTYDLNGDEKIDTEDIIIVEGNFQYQYIP